MGEAERDGGRRGRKMEGERMEVDDTWESTGKGGGERNGAGWGKERI